MSAPRLQSLQTCSPFLVVEFPALLKPFPYSLITVFNSNSMEANTSTSRAR